MRTERRSDAVCSIEFEPGSNPITDMIDKVLPVVALTKNKNDVHRCAVG